MKLIGHDSAQGSLRKYNSPAPEYTLLLGYAFSDTATETQT